jgi:hypothetical protein
VRVTRAIGRSVRFSSVPQDLRRYAARWHRDRATSALRSGSMGLAEMHLDMAHALEHGEKAQRYLTHSNTVLE